ncbi:VOC family protein [Cryobacterium sp. TMT2-10]|uniref:VOC family protein n=1 Tax=Cryobacterium shii TaxID=1259235 RepID=A0AAQ2C725_9MICO|nr:MULTISPECIES: VOC family protein [Cryobacterium]TFC49808.1 VOC family protein [Cryobacterium shii]TFD16138.1 VOC family protein [Cryobacterium sp. TMT4-10]TFD39774.1 VOC family protein [Cryobacterium sp. TMT2-10]
MPTRDTTRTGEPCWADLMTSDPARAREFYTRLFGWTASDSGEEYGGYVTFRLGDADVAGMMGQDADSDRPDAWTTYLAVTDADATVAAARDAGAQVLAEPMTMGDMGRMATLLDPSGAAVGLWQPIEFTGFGRIEEAGTPVWHELNTTNYAAALRFYESVFGWTPVSLSDTDEFRYSTVGPDGNQVTGIFDASAHLPHEVPSHWQLYLGVTDVKAAARRVDELGGTVLHDPWESEFGTFARVADPTGAVFVLGSVDRPSVDQQNVD